MEFGIKCPYCEYEHDGLDYLDCEDMEGEFLMHCEKCLNELKKRWIRF